MTTVRHPTENLIHELASAFVDKPEALEVVSQPALDKAVYFALKGHPGDEGRLVGTGGSHVDALTFLVGMIGGATGEKFTFRLITCARPDERTTMKPKHVLTYDPERARALLDRILTALGFIDHKVVVGKPNGPQFSLSFTFTIVPINEEARESLINPFKIVIFPESAEKPEKAIEMRLVEALGTLFRAIARKEGVKFSVEVEDAR